MNVFIYTSPTPTSPYLPLQTGTETELLADRMLEEIFQAMHPDGVRNYISEVRRGHLCVCKCVCVCVCVCMSVCVYECVIVYVCTYMSM